MSKLGIAAAVIIGLIFVKDGTIPGLLGDLAKAGGDAAKGLKPLTGIA